ncbi:MAG: NAD(P)H:quinone oxidoreductase [Alphaproteobacteria bacterium]|nr:NAD(P)H:quinone oxidoreductase [Alphaproteobacteria bacterium]
MRVRIAVIHYSATGVIHRLATSLAEGAASAGAEVRLRRVHELAPAESIASNPRWQAHHQAESAAGGTPLASLDDLAWADGIALGSPTRFGGPAAQLKNFLDQSGTLWIKGVLAQKVVTAFTAASTAHGGLESTVLAMLNIAYHWGAIIMPLGYGPSAVKATGNPYGASWVSRKGSLPDEPALAAAHAQGVRLVHVAGALRGDQGSSA